MCSLVFVCWCLIKTCVPAHLHTQSPTLSCRGQMKAPIYSKPCTSHLRRMADLSPSCQAHHGKHVRYPTASAAAAQGCVSSCCSAARVPLTFQAEVPPYSTADPANRTLPNPAIPRCHCHLDSRFRCLVNSLNPDSLV